MGRIIAGGARGTRLVAPDGRATRPTTDRVREALFNALDLFSGSGAVGLEAASRGADPVHLVERDRRAAGVICRNLAATGLGARLHVRDVAAFLAAPAPVVFDVIVADPPYALPGDELSELLGAAVSGGFLVDDGLLVVERSSRDPEPRWPDGFGPGARRDYGETALFLCRPAKR